MLNLSSTSTSYPFTLTLTQIKHAFILEFFVSGGQGMSTCSLVVGDEEANTRLGFKTVKRIKIGQCGIA
ncbi:hypothetical protein VNO77_05765 [Canavalia gladiata]|uniref:Uncharacterized protein n=1 Tax=Canavalia gladiata TaxID=3824 RepID=A0AAN9MZP9_CANGL